MVFVDLETTGANPGQDRITEIGIIQCDPDGVREWSSLVNPGVPIPAFIERLTGITNAAVANAPAFAEVASEVAGLLDGHLFVAHNARFDYSFLKSEFGRAGLEFEAAVLCTVKLSRRLFPEFRRHSLDALIERHGLTAEGGRHRALGDARLIHRFWEGLPTRVDAEVLAAAVRAATSRTVLPEHIDPAVIEALPEGAGVYVFYGPDGEALHVGRAKDVRRRVLAHFAGDNGSEKEAGLAGLVRGIEGVGTGGEVGALLMEAVLLRRLRPALAGSSRLDSEFHSWRLTAREGSPSRLELVAGAEIDFGRQEGLYGLFRSAREARAMLGKLALRHGLCRGLLGLEDLAAGKPCSAVQGGRCRGACVGLEPVARHGLRLVAALAGLQLRAWPFPGPAVIQEREVAHVVNGWRFLGSARSDEEVMALLDQDLPPFDGNIYRILEKHRTGLRPLPSGQSRAGMPT